jgi:hypothetical protein
MARVLLTQAPLLPALVRRGAAAAAVGFTVSCGGQSSGTGSTQTPQPSGMEAGSTFVAPVEAGEADAAAGPDAAAPNADATAPNADAAAPNADAQSVDNQSADAAGDADGEAGPPDAGVFLPPLPPPPLPPK